MSGDTRRLALFDLDHTLIPFDSAMAWNTFLVERGHRPPQGAQAYLDCCRRYVAGQAGIEAVHRAAVAPMAGCSRMQLDAWLREFEAAIAPRVPVDMQALVARHRQAGDLCAIVTATTALIAGPFARLLQVPHLLATHATLDAQGVPDGGIDGAPCHRQHKPQRVTQWLAGQGLTLGSFAQSWFYSDAASDLPLLQAVSHPVAVRPDAGLRTEAEARGWPVMGSRG